MDCCQLEDNSHNVKREETGGNDPENGSPDADRGGKCCWRYWTLNSK